MRIFLVAGEPSGDALGAALMAGLKTLAPGVAFDGIGGPLMQAEGLESRFEMSELSVMGIAEVLPKYRHLKRRIRETAEAVLADPPAALVTIDSPDFCLRVAKLVKAVIPAQTTIHMVAPTVWAWRPGRAEKMARVIDHVLALFPFEPPYMEAAGMSCDFIGHPIVAQEQATPHAAAAYRANLGVQPGAPLILALPGSRRGEVTRLAESFGAALAPVIERHPEARVVVPTVAATQGLVQDLTARWPGNPVILEPSDARTKRAAFAAADLALAASGTVSLELAAARTPMVVAYDMAWFSRVVISRMLMVDTVTLVNLVTDTRAVPEFIGEACKPEPISKALLEVLEAPEAQYAAMEMTMELLGQDGEAPGLRAARSVLQQVSP